MAVAYMTTMLNTANRKAGFVPNVNATGALAVDLDAGSYDNKIYTLTGNITSLTVTGDATSNGTVILKFIQDATGSRTMPSTGTPLSWASNVIWNQGTLQQPNAQASSESVFLGVWDGTNLTF